MHYYHQPLHYFTDVISLNQLELLIEFMAEAMSGGDYQEGQSKPDVEELHKIYGKRKPRERRVT